MALEGRVGRHKSTVGPKKCTFELPCSNSFVVELHNGDVYIDITNHNIPKIDHGQPEYDIRNMGEFLKILLEQVYLVSILYFNKGKKI